jgi:hypothetical protein
VSDDWLENVIAEAAERGEFDDLPGAGKPIDGLQRGYDPDWWAKGFVSRERAKDAGIDLMVEIGRTLPALLANSELEEVARQVDAWNATIGRVNEHVDVVDRLQLLEMAVIEPRWSALRR